MPKDLKEIPKSLGWPEDWTSLAEMLRQALHITINDVIWSSWQMPAQFWSSISNLGAMVGRDEYEAIHACFFRQFAQSSSWKLLYSAVKVFIQILQCKVREVGLRSGGMYRLVTDMFSESDMLWEGLYR